MTDRIYLYDSTLRDGAQTQGVDFTPKDKRDIALMLDELGIDYIEGGWPGANPTDDKFFEKLPTLKKSKITAFGMTRRAGTSVDNDPSLNALLNSGVKHICVVGKTWDFQVEHALNTTAAENLKMISESVSYIRKKNREVFFDAEHFFDGYKASPKFALSAIEAAFEAGARWIVLCDTNGGTLPHEVEEIVKKISKNIPGENLGIHCHNDTENAVANSLMAVRSGARQIQGTLNGLGERCGNANLVSIIPNLMLKMGFSTGVSKENLKHLTHISRFLNDRLNRAPNIYAPYVGEAAFAHKGGLHVSAINKNPLTYEHIEPELVGNTRNILVSDQSGKANIMARLKDIGIKIDMKDPEIQGKIANLIIEIKSRENQGYAYDSATASFELLARKFLSNLPEFFELQSFRVMDERRISAKGQLVNVSEATVKVKIGKKLIMTVAEGNGPVNALDRALRKALAGKYPALKEIALTDYKVRILTAGEGTEAVTRVLIECCDEKGDKWGTVGVSANVINASYNALYDAISYKLIYDAPGKVS